MPGFQGRRRGSSAPRKRVSVPGPAHPPSCLRMGTSITWARCRHLLQKLGCAGVCPSVELPYLTGRSAYPPPDPTVGGGAMAALSRFYPRGPFEFSGRIRPLPETVPCQECRSGAGCTHPAIHPGTSPFFGSPTGRSSPVMHSSRQSRSRRYRSTHLQAGNHGPPAYFTPDWVSARSSVERLAALEPWRVATGHGPPSRVQKCWTICIGLHGTLTGWRYPAWALRSQPAVSDERAW